MLLHKAIKVHRYFIPISFINFDSKVQKVTFSFWLSVIIRIGLHGSSFSSEVFACSTFGGSLKSSPI